MVGPGFAQKGKEVGGSGEYLFHVIRNECYK